MTHNSPPPTPDTRPSYEQAMKTKLITVALARLVACLKLFGLASADRSLRLSAADKLSQARNP